MPAYGIAQSGWNPPPNQGLNLADVVPGETIVLFDGTETAAAGLASIAFARGYSPDAADNGITFNLSGMPAGMTVDVQVCSPPAGGFASTAAMAAAFSTVATIAPDSGGNGWYTDVGRSAFYRLQISAYTSGAMCVGVAQR